MADAGPAIDQATTLPLKRVISHRKLIAKVFPRSMSDEMRHSISPVDREMFHCAASQGMLSSILVLLSDGKFSCDMPDGFGRTPLHWAAEQGHRNVVFALLRAGACVDPRSHRKATPIMLAASRGHEAVVRVLLKYRAGESDCPPLDCHRRGIEHWRSTALHCSAAAGHVRTVELLLDAGFNREQRDGAGLTPAEISARTSHVTSAAITHLLLPTSDMGGKLVHDYTNMMVEDVAMVSGLVKGGAFLGWRDGTGYTPLHRAVHFHHAIVSRLLLQAGADPNPRDHHGASPLHVAAGTGREEIVADLLEAGADTELQTVGGYSPLSAAVANNRVSGNRMNVVRLLLNAGASTEHRDVVYGQTSLSWACRSGLAPIVRVLLEAGADVESRSSAGLTPLHLACRYNSAESVEALLNAGADPNVVDQVAADAVAKSSFKSGTSVSMPIAIDVIGLGCSLERVEDPRYPSVAVAARRLDIASVKRIQSALQSAQQEHSWRRRGWLVILANRRTTVEKVGARGERRPVIREGCSSAILPASMTSRCVDTTDQRPPYSHQKKAAWYRVDDCSYSGRSETHQPRGKSSDGSSIVKKRLRRVDDAIMVLSRGNSCDQRQTCGYMGAQENVAALLPKTVYALLELAAVEVGLFHRVVMFI